MNITVERIKEVMGDMTQEQFADSINSSQPVISKVINGDQPSINVLIGISKKYKVSVDWLLGLSSQKNLSGYTKYEEAVSTYADVINVIVKMIRNKTCTFIKKNEVSEMSLFSHVEDCHDMLQINDPFIRDVISSVSSLNDTNPETIDGWIKNIVLEYNIPLMECTESLRMMYYSNKGFMSSLEMLKQYYDSFNQYNNGES